MFDEVSVGNLMKYQWVRTGKAITTHSCFFSIIEILPGCWSVCRWTLLQSWMSHLKVLTN